MRFLESEDDDKHVPLNEAECNAVLFFVMIAGLIIYQANHTSWLPYIF